MVKRSERSKWHARIGRTVTCHSKSEICGYVRKVYILIRIFKEGLPPKLEDEKR